MSRRIRQHYQAILDGDGSDYIWFYHWKYSQEENNAWAAYFFYKEFGTREGVDFYRIQKFVLAGPPEVVYEWARNIKGANIRRCQSVILERGTPEMLRKFAMNIPGARQ